MPINIAITDAPIICIGSRLSSQRAKIAIAKESEASEVTSAAFVRKHSLQSPSAVQNAIRNLLNLQMITYRQDGRTKVYSVSDRFLQMWIVRKY